MLLICLLLAHSEPALLYKGADYNGSTVPNIAYPTKGKYNLSVNSSNAWKPANGTYLCVNGSLYLQ